eukprot:Nk52_evm18s1763 gene=Nk52_evmTU18s1763
MAHLFMNSGDYSHLGKYYTDENGLDLMVCAYHGREICNQCCVDHKYTNDLTREEHGVRILQRPVVVDVNLLHDGSEDDDEDEVAEEDVREKKGCRVCGRSRDRLKMCSACGKVWYCSTDCQKIDWQRGHKQECKKWKKEGADGGSGGRASSSTNGNSIRDAKCSGVSISQVKECVCKDYVDVFNVPFLKATVEAFGDFPLQRSGSKGECAYEVKAREECFVRLSGRDSDEKGLDYHLLLVNAFKHRYDNLDKCLRFVMLAIDHCLQSLGPCLKSCQTESAVVVDGKRIIKDEDKLSVLVGRFIAAIFLKNWIVAESGYVQLSGDYEFIVKILNDCTFVQKGGFVEYANEAGSGSDISVRSEWVRVVSVCLSGGELNNVLGMSDAFTHLVEWAVCLGHTRAYNESRSGESLEDKSNSSWFSAFVNSVWVNEIVLSKIVYVPCTVSPAVPQIVAPRDIVSTAYEDLVSSELADLLGRTYYEVSPVVYVKKPSCDSRAIVASTLQYRKSHDFVVKCINNEKKSSKLLKRYLPMSNYGMNEFVREVMGLTSESVKRKDYLKAYEYGMYMTDLFMRYDDDPMRKYIRPESFFSYTRGRTICYHLMKRQCNLSLYLESNAVSESKRLKYLVEMLRESDYVLNSGVVDLVSDADEEKILNVRISLRIYLEAVFFLTEIAYRREFNKPDGPLDMDNFSKTFDQMWKVPLVSRTLVLDAAQCFQQLRKTKRGMDGKRGKASLRQEPLLFYGRYCGLESRAMALGLPSSRHLKAIPTQEEILRSNVIEGSGFCYICSVSIGFESAVRCERCKARLYCSEKCRDEHANVLHSRECVELRAASYKDNLCLELQVDVHAAETLLAGRLRGETVQEFFSGLSYEGLAVVERSYRDAPALYVKVKDIEPTYGDEVMLFYEYRKRCYMKTAEYRREQQHYSISDLYADFDSFTDVKANLRKLNRCIFHMLEKESTIARLAKDVKKQLHFCLEKKIETLMNYLKMNCLSVGELDQEMAGELFQDLEFLLNSDSMKMCSTGTSQEAIERMYFQVEKMMNEHIKIISDDSVELDELTDFVSAKYHPTENALVRPRVLFSRNCNGNSPTTAETPALISSNVNISTNAQGTSFSDRRTDEDVLSERIDSVSVEMPAVPRPFEERQSIDSPTTPRLLSATRANGEAGQNNESGSSWLSTAEDFYNEARQRRQTNRVNRSRRSRREGRARAFQINDHIESVSNVKAKEGNAGAVKEAIFVPCRELKDSNLCTFEDHDSCICCYEIWSHFPKSVLAAVFPCGHLMCTICLLKFDKAQEALACHLCRSELPSDIVDKLCGSLVDQQLSKQCKLLSSSKSRLFGSKELTRQYLVGLVRSTKLNCDKVCDIVYELIASSQYGETVDMTHEQKQEIYTVAQAPILKLKEEKESLRRRKNQLEKTNQLGTRKYEMLIDRYTAVCDKLQSAYNCAADDIFERINSGSRSMGRSTFNSTARNSSANEKNNGDEDTILQIDLHGLSPGQAVRKLNELVKPILPVVQKVLIVTGKGLHSAASGTSVLKEAVLRYCRDHNSSVSEARRSRARDASSSGASGILRGQSENECTMSFSEVPGNAGVIEMVAHFTK